MIMKEYGRSKFVEELKRENGFEIVNDTFKDVPEVYNGIVVNGTVSQEYKDKGYKICKRLIALGGYRLTDAIKEVMSSLIDDH